MAKRKKNVTEIQDIELQPQVIGYSYKKKSNLGRVIFVFVAFILVVYYINDISVYVNNLIGKRSADTIEDLSNDDNNTSKNTISNLVCIKDENNITYKFVNGELTNVVHAVTKTSATEEEKASAKEKVNSLKSTLGVTASFDEFTDGYKAVYDIDLDSADITKFNEESYFSYKEKVESISSTMSNKGYSCN